MSGRVCGKHNQYYEVRCPWCEEPEVADPGFSVNRHHFMFWRAAPPPVSAATVQAAMKAMRSRLAKADRCECGPCLAGNQADCQYKDYP